MVVLFDIPLLCILDFHEARLLHWRHWLCKRHRATADASYLAESEHAFIYYETTMDMYNNEHIAMKIFRGPQRQYLYYLTVDA